MPRRGALPGHKVRNIFMTPQKVCDSDLEGPSLASTWANLLC